MAGINSSTTEKAKKKTFKEKFEFEQIQKDLAELEAEKQQLDGKLNSGAGSHPEIMEWSKRIGEVVNAIHEKELRWLTLSELPD